MRRAIAILVLGLALDAAAGPVRIPGESAPKAVASLGPLDGAIALAISEDGSRAAAAFLDAKKNQASIVRLADASTAAAEIPVRGVVRALAFDAEGGELLVVADRRSKRTIGETFLQRIDTASRESIREIVLPRDARDLAVKDERTLLLASDDEIRTFAMPAFTSGPLYRLDGANLALATVPGTSRVVVGREDGLLLVDLRDPQDRDGLPVRERVATAGAVAEIVVSSDGRTGWARLTEGTVYRFGLDPLSLGDAEGRAAWIGWVGEAGDAAPAPAAETVKPVAAAAVVAAPVVAAPPATPPPSPPPAPAEIEPQKAAEPESAPMEAPKPEAAPPPVEPPPRIEGGTAPPITPHDARMDGRVTGAAMASVVAVVILGPDNILHEAARVKPDASGHWFVKDLPSGTYRILLDAGGGRLVESSPPFRTVVVGPEGIASTEPIEALRIR